MSETDLFGEIAALAAKHGETSADTITPQTRLAGDLGLDGDDAHEFVAAFSEHYGVDFDGFVWLRYFGDEGWDFLRPTLVAAAKALSPAFARRWRAAQDAEREVTIAHLVEVAQAKRWRHPGPEHAVARRPSAFATLLGAAMSLPILALGAFGLIALYGLATGAVAARLLQGAVVVLMAAMPFYFGWVSWRNIQRKLASG
jgi:acyl carrier protein